MSFGLLQYGATPRSADTAPGIPAPGVEGALAPSERVFRVSTARPETPAEVPFQAREQVRQQVMSERGYDMLSLFKLSSQDRIRAEATILAETARRAGQARAKEMGAFVDLRV